MGRWVISVGGAAALAFAAPVSAQTMPVRATATTVGQVCNENQAACLTYVVGSLDGFFATMVALGRPVTICFPANVNNAQITQVAVRYLRAHPELGNRSGAEVVIGGVHQAYPCQAPVPRPPVPNAQPRR